MAGTTEGAAKRKRCKCGAFAHGGDCPTHLGMKLREGITRNRPGRDLMERVWEKIETKGPDECWLWTGGLDQDGYGTIHAPGDKRFKAHRLVIDAQPGQIVMHSCDTPACCNPAHLSVGTQADNMRDMVSKGRQQAKERHWNARLTAEQVEAIRADPRPSTVTCKDYGITDSAVRKIRRGARW